MGYCLRYCQTLSQGSCNSRGKARGSLWPGCYCSPLNHRHRPSCLFPSHVCLALLCDRAGSCRAGGSGLQTPTHHIPKRPRCPAGLRKGPSNTCLSFEPGISQAGKAVSYSCGNKPSWRLPRRGEKNVVATSCTPPGWHTQAVLVARKSWELHNGAPVLEEEDIGVG